mmetsp:Transcript_12924/g.21141  ORF Transcript_12924/g.21141 Transcript_12924/m.21141 type:complete len:513 (+) Transcript_12924:47-1585(+)
MWCRPHGITGTPPAERWGHSATLHGTKLLIFGGETLGDSQSDNAVGIHALDFDTLQWSKPDNITGKAPTERWGHTATLWGTKIVIFGGFDGTADYNDICILDTETWTWNKNDENSSNGSAPAERSGHSASLIGDKLYVFGGDSGGVYRNDLWILDLETWHWKKPEGINGTFPPPRSGHTASVIDRKLYIIGGDGGNRYYNDVFSLDLDQMVWTEYKGSGKAPQERSGHTQVVVGRTIVLFGGHGSAEDARDCYFNDVVMLNVDKMEWLRSDSPPGPMPQPRSGHSAVLSASGHEMYIIGGENGGGDYFYNDVYMLDLVGSGAVCIPSSTIIKNLRNALNQKEFSDLTIVTAEGKSIYAHKIILFTNCPHFKVLYQSGMQDSKVDQIKIPDAYVVVYALLEFLYTDEVNEDVRTSAAIAIDLLQLADMYFLERLKHLCQTLIPRNININNVAYVFQRAVAIRASYIQDFAQHYMFTHFGQVAKTEGFWTLTNDKVALREFYNSMPDAAIVHTT